MSNGFIDISTPTDNPHIVLITINNEKIANALEMEMFARFAQLTDELKDARAIIVTGKGDKHFCCGANIKQWAALSPEDFATKWVGQGLDAFETLTKLQAVVIMAINGTCFGGGLELALHGDIRICSANARFALPETGIGILPGWGGVTLLERLTNAEITARLALTGEILDAQKALDIGLVSEVVAQDKLIDAALELAQKCAKRSPVANGLSKKLLWQRDDAKRKQYEDASLQARLSEDSDEGINSFKEKRKPNF